MGDAFVSCEHILLALIQSDKTVARFFKECGVLYDTVFTVCKDFRGSDRIDTPDPDATYQALEKYTINLCERAKSGVWIRLWEGMRKLTGDSNLKS